MLQAPGRPILEKGTSSTSNPKEGGQSSSRLPPPALFQGPPSRNASNVSIAFPGSNAAAIGQPLAATVGHPPRFPHIPDSEDPLLPSSSRNIVSDVKNENDRTDAVWAEMQNTLAEVELSASSGSHLFSAAHAKALDDLRTSQLALAQAWAKSEADEGISHYPEDSAEPQGKPAAQSSQGQSKKGNSEGNPDMNLEEQTQRDIESARKRREANDRYFQQVNNGVLDVVAKLDEVARAMKQVEKETREIWSESESSASPGVTERTESPMTTRS